MEEINIKEFLGYIKEKVLYVIIAIILCVSAFAAYDLFIKTPKYSTYATIALVKANESATMTQNDLNVNKSLVSTYSVIVKSKKVLKATIEESGLKYTPEELSNEISVSSPDEVNLIKITVQDKSAKNAYKITKTLADVFSKEVANTYEMNNIRIIEEPEITDKVSNNTLKRDLILGFAIGLFLSVGVLFVIFYFDDTIKYHDDIEEELGLPILAKVFKSRLGDKKKPISTELILAKYPKSVVSESIKTFRTNLEFTSIDKTIRTMLITSSVPGEGKSFISANLAISFAQSNKRVLIIDADMRKGRLHKLFRVNNTKGYSNLLLDKPENFIEYVKKTSVDGVSVITRGTIPPNPSELLGSTKNKELIKELKNHFDKIIFDGVPCSGMPDSIIMSSLVDSVVIVASNKMTPKNEFINTKNVLLKAKAPISGFIVNKIDSTQGTYGKYYYYYGDKN
ncbi:MAG: polysaccharide biosynthesis tyrosine autokinase [Bacilli bacterium]|nr:polysaccharide biosynthesis tyrosine autokinase [Bacilli bacterium]